MRTFEERVGRELDSLYQAALFLHAGSRSAAEGHLLEALRRSFPDDPVSTLGLDPDPGLGSSFARWIEGRLVADFFRSVQGSGVPRRVRSHPIPTSSASPMSAGELCAAALHVAPEARAVLWLVVIRRWAYAETAETLGIPIEKVRELLTARSDLNRALGRSARATDERQGGARGEGVG